MPASLSASQGADSTFEIGMIIFPGMTKLDFAGPLEVFARLPQTKVHVLAKERSPVVTDVGLHELPTLLLSEAPELHLLFVGGGPGVNALMEDREVLEFLRARAPRAQWITSVCTGALVLGAAGLLRGYRAATHWTAMEVLREFGAIPEARRVVIDRNRITGGGVTAGIDFGLTIASCLHGDDYAQASQLAMEYAPQPPFDTGSPATAPAALVERVAEGARSMTEARMALARRIVSREDWV